MDFVTCACGTQGPKQPDSIPTGPAGWETLFSSKGWETLCPECWAVYQQGTQRTFLQEAA
jgi:hypothetical protein